VGVGEIREPVEIFLNQLHYSVTEEELATALSDLGKISRVHIGKDEDGKSRGFAVVRMLSLADLATTIESAYGREFCGMRIHVERARPRQTEADMWARRSA